ncbi:MAG: Zn-ribbon domain-containing OB-fold protein [Thermoflavifilum sp.]|nr:Zn-ribbon domain-containing OB-fold protein [Thermoflavifilum sp.]MCL6513614.1 Zn-ribbon domain-containing OB-fold protein [Alicyclobacillus sp.]
MAHGIPRPVEDADSRPFWEGCREGVLRIQRCASCGRHVFYPRLLCPHCFSDQLSWVEASGAGRIHTYTVVHRAFGPFQADVPYVVALVDLDEGVRMMTRILGDRSSVRIGARVRVEFVEADEGLVLPYFRVMDEATAS